MAIFARQEGNILDTDEILSAPVIPPLIDYYEQAYYPANKPIDVTQNSIFATLFNSRFHNT